MKLYLWSFTLIAHSYLRWALLVLALVNLASAVHGWRTGRAWGKREERLAVSFVGLADLQLMLGLVLLASSPIVGAALSVGMKLAMKDPILRFFAVEHPVQMLLAIAALHIGRVKSRKASEARAKHRYLAIGALVWAALAAAAIPWPGLRHGRPLVRTELRS